MNVSEPAPLITADVRVGRLVQHIDVTATVQSDSRLTFAPPQLPSSTAAVITWSNSSPEGIEAGSRIVDVAGQPVFAMKGTIPMYRPLTVGTEGPDVTQLQSSLEAIGYDLWDHSGTFGRSTAWALIDLYDSQDTAPIDSAGKRLDLKTPDAISIPAGTFVYANSFPLSLSKACQPVGTTMADGSCSLQTVARSAYASLTAAQSALVAPGMEVITTLPDGTSETGTLGEQMTTSDTLPLAAASDSTAGNDTPVTATEAAAPGQETAPQTGDSEETTGALPQFKLNLASLPSAASFSVSISVRSTDADVLIVPESALSESAESTYTVSVVTSSSSGSIERPVPVEVGLCVDGECQISSEDPTLPTAKVAVSRSLN